MLHKRMAPKTKRLETDSDDILKRTPTRISSARKYHNELKLAKKQNEKYLTAFVAVPTTYNDSSKQDDVIDPLLKENQTEIVTSPSTSYTQGTTQLKNNKQRARNMSVLSSDSNGIPEKCSRASTLTNSYIANLRNERNEKENNTVNDQSLQNKPSFTGNQINYLLHNSSLSSTSKKGFRRYEAETKNKFIEEMSQVSIEFQCVSLHNNNSNIFRIIFLQHRYGMILGRAIQRNSNLKMLFHILISLHITMQNNRIVS